jgi:parvulin-like peptidyl-prolyl isomerase
MSRVIRDADQYHLVQVINRVTEGSIPEMRWVEDEIRRQLILQGRKQTFARTVQNLRNMATARNDLEVRIRDDDEGQ